MGGSGAKLPSANANESVREKNVIQEKVEDFDFDSCESKTNESNNARTNKTNQELVSLKD